MRLLDLFCGAGGATQGYRNAGFTEIWGVDINPQPNYPGDHFIQADIFDPNVPFDLWPIYLPEFDLYHASPPCQAYSTLRHSPGAEEYPDLVAPTRFLLQQTGKPYVIENVPGAPLINPIRLCGSMFNLRHDGHELRRHRLFEISFPGVWVTECKHELPVLGVYGDISRTRRKSNRGVKAGLNEAAALMGIDWMTPKELTQAIPPAYTEFIGREFIRQQAHAA